MLILYKKYELTFFNDLNMFKALQFEIFPIQTKQAKYFTI